MKKIIAKNLRFLSITVLAAILTGCAPCHVRQKPVAQNARFVPGADRYAGWIRGCLASMEDDVDRMLPSAEYAARLHVEKGWPIGVDGEPGAVGEALGRCGGMMRMQSAARRQPPFDPGIVLYFLCPGGSEEDGERIRAHKNSGSYVIVFGASDLLGDMKKRKIPFDADFSNHAAEGGGLFRNENGEYFIPTHKPANIAVLWTWTGEFTAACTRLGKMPLVYQGFHVTGGLQYAQRNVYIYGPGGQGNDFYRERPEPMAPGVAGHAFLKRLRRETESLIEHETGSIRAISMEAAQRIAGRKEGKVYSFLSGHSIIQRARVAYDPVYFPPVNTDWTHIRETLKFAKDDLLFYVDFCMIQNSSIVDDARHAGTRMAWSIATFFSEELDSIMPDEYIVDQQWSYDDAVVRFPGFELKVFPTSGFLAEAVLWMTSADVYQRLACDDFSGTPDVLRGRTCLYIAASDNDLSAAEKLLKQKNIINKQDVHGLTALHIAAQLGYDDMVRILLKAKASPAVRDCWGRTPLHLAASRGHAQTVKLLLDAGAPVRMRDKSGETPLHRAARNGNPEIVRQLLSKDKSCLEIRDARGRTALHAAAQKGSAEAAVLLIGKGAKVAAVDNDHLQPLHFAALESRPEMVRLLLENGADISAKDRWGRIALHWAAGKNNTEVVQELLDAGSAPNSPDSYGRTPLFDAANSSAYDVLELLLKHGANPGLRSNNNLLPQDGSPEKSRQILNEYMDK